MPDHTKPLVQNIERNTVMGRLKIKADDDARKYGIPCRCSCACKVRFRFGDCCTLCRDGDHYADLDSYLAKIGTS